LIGLAGISLDILYFVAVILLSLSSLFNSGFGAFFSSLASGVFGYIIIKIVVAWLGSADKQ
jgi:hypothetical protein